MGKKLGREDKQWNHDGIRAEKIKNVGKKENIWVNRRKNGGKINVKFNVTGKKV